MPLHYRALVLTLVLCLSEGVFAAAIATYDATIIDGTAQDNQPSANLVQLGVTATMAAGFTVTDPVPGGVTPTEINLSAGIDALGVNVNPATPFSAANGDSTVNIDGAFGDEAITITFDAPVALNSLTLTDFTSETAVLIIGGQPFSLTSKVGTNDVYTAGVEFPVIPLASGASIVLTRTDANAYGLVEFAVLVPEPSGIVSLLGAPAVLLAARRRS